MFTGVVSVVPTRRRRFLWAAWWKAPPEADPFRPPDAASGGSRTREEARAEAERAAATTLVEIDGHWAGAWSRVLRGLSPWPKARGGKVEPRAREPKVPEGSRPWALALLGVDKEASIEDIKRAFRTLALKTHPDRGGDDQLFVEAKRAFDLALARVGEGHAKRRRRR